jgi:DNA polymerase-3 subunit delta'
MTNPNFTSNWGVYGHEWAVGQLRSALRHHRARHAYLIVGAEGVGKATLARGFAMALNCLQPDAEQHPCGECSSCQRILSGNHADILYSLDDGAMKVEEARAVAGRLSLKPYEGHYRIAILRDFDRAAPIAQDALLKTLEEPPPQAVLILLAESTERVLPTIISRSQTIHLRPVPAETTATVLRNLLMTAREAADEPYTDDDDAHVALLAQLCGGRIGWAIRALYAPELLDGRAAALDTLDTLLTQNRIGRFALAEDLSKDKANTLAYLDLWQTCWRDLMLLTEHADLPIANTDRAEHLAHVAARLTPDETLKALQATREMISTLSYTNANTRLALEVLLLDYPMA